MEAWLQIVVRQLILYSLPVLISLSCIAMLEAKLNHRSITQPFAAITGRGIWLPLLASVACHRGIIITGYGILTPGVKAAAIRCFGHLLLCLAGFLLYAFSLKHMPPTGLPPLHHWWAKVLMFFNLCMICMHLLPLPGQIVGEWLRHSRLEPLMIRLTESRYNWLLLTLLAASPLLDLLPGTYIVFPVYESLSIAATNW